ncbi:MAG: site-specific integrase [Acidimicrobiales bacterium]
MRALGTRKPSRHTLAAYRRDLHGVGARLAEAEGVELDELALEHLTKAALRGAFSSWATDHAAASLARAWSSWSTFFASSSPRTSSRETRWPASASRS